MATNSDTGKFNIIGYINGYIMSICGKPHWKPKREDLSFTVKISTSAKANVGMFGTHANSNAGPINISSNGTVT